MILHRAVINASLLFLALTAAGCASAPAVPAPKTVQTAEPQPPRVSLICQGKAVLTRFEQLGVPRGEEELAVAVGKEATYVLFKPARLVRLTRQEGKVQVEMALGRPGESWTAMDIDPVDGSVWLASENLSLVQITPAWKSRAVKLQKVEGRGGFQRLLVAPDAIYAVPACADTAVWRIDRQGRVLGTSFPAAPPREAAQGEPVQLDELRCSQVRLERDADDRILAWDPVRKTLQRADDRGAWTAVDLGVFRAVQDARDAQTSRTVVKGVAVGRRNEAWYVEGGPRDLFRWKGKPVFLGPIASRSAGGRDTLLLVPEGDRVREVVENCYGAVIAAIATSPTQYAAITADAVILGDFATAPDLP